MRSASPCIEATIEDESTMLSERETARRALSWLRSLRPSLARGKQA